MLGGTAQFDDWSLDIRDEDNDLILKKVEAIWPELDRDRIIGGTVGLRPSRTEVGLRKSIEGVRVIHNYGHGGRVTLSWGCRMKWFQLQRGLVIAMHEIFDIVDVEDKVIGRASREEVHRQGFLHRSTHLLVFDDKGRVLLQKRSIEKDTFPGKWDSSVSGHVDSGAL